MAKILSLTAFCLFMTILAHSAAGIPKIESVLVRKASRDPDSKVNLLITLNSRPAQVREQISERSYIQRSDRITDLVNGLKANAEASQASVLGAIKSSKYFGTGAEEDKNNPTKIKSLWISNQIVIRNADLHLLQELQERDDILSIEVEKPVHLDLPIDLHVQKGDPDEDDEDDEDGEFTTADVSFEWNIERVLAPLVWAAGYNGSGVLVANIDTGVRATHETLASNYKNDAYSWFDPYTHVEKPYDDGGHGTHTLATIVGTPETYGVGVAPGAKWITCKGFDPDGLGWPAEILECAQFVLCPHRPDGTNPDCSQAPRVVSNSWNSRDDSAVWFNEMVEAWHAAGIIPVHSNGNYGEACCTVGSQAPLKVLAVGATTIDEELAWFSSRGPSSKNVMKPDISAPGMSVRSAYHGHDSQYAVASGTSMACPHVAGAVALLLSVDPSLNYDQISLILLTTTERNLTFTEAMCGNRRDSEFPNNHFGHGRLNALAAYARLLQANGGHSPSPQFSVLALIISISVGVISFSLVK